MLLLYSTLVFVLFLNSNKVYGYAPQSETCNPNTNVYFLEDPTGPQSFLKCKDFGNSNYGYWERHYCPKDMNFEFSTQQCQIATSAEPNILRRDNDRNEIDDGLLKIAILNGSCVNGEYCIGGTVCDQQNQKCMCPYGTTVDLETLSCIQPDLQQQNSNNNPQTYYQGYKNTESEPIAGSQIYGIPINTNGGSTNVDSSIILPESYFSGYYSNNLQTYSTTTQQSPVFNNLNTMKTEINNNYWSSQDFSNVETVPSSSLNLSTADLNTITTLSKVNPSEYYQSLLDQILQFQKNLAEKVSANLTFEVPTTTTQVSFNTKSSTEANQYFNLQSSKTLLSAEQIKNRNVLSASRMVKIAGIGAKCTQTATNEVIVLCGESSTCVNGHCVCVLPLHEQNGRCVPFEQKPTQNLKQEKKFQKIEVGPGDSCLSNQTCGSGSVCGKKIPICICPANTYFRKGFCVTNDQEIGETNNDSNVKNLQTKKIVTTTTYLPDQKMLSKTSIIKRKNLLVGNKCSQNTDCLLGAYCNGNTQPPTCQCLSTHVSVDATCEKVIYPGQNGCRSDLQCAASYSKAICNTNGQCVCPVGTTASEQTCVLGNNTNNSLTNNNPIKHLTICMAPTITTQPKVKCLKARCLCCPANSSNFVQNQLLCDSKNQSKRQNSDNFFSPYSAKSKTFSMFFCRPNLPESTESSKTELNETNDHQKTESEGNCIWKNCQCEAMEKENTNHSAQIIKERTTGIDQIFLTLSMLQNADLARDTINPNLSNGTTNSSTNKIYRRQKENLKQKVMYTQTDCSDLLNSKTKENFVIQCSGKQMELKKNYHVNNTILCALGNDSINLAEFFCNENLLQKLSEQIGDEIITKQKRNVKRDDEFKDTSTINKEHSKSDYYNNKVKHRGEKCLAGDVCLSGTSCISGVCDCPTNYRFQKNKCTKFTDNIQMQKITIKSNKYVDEKIKNSVSSIPKPISKPQKKIIISTTTISNDFAKAENSIKFMNRSKIHFSESFIDAQNIIQSSNNTVDPSFQTNQFSISNNFDNNNKIVKANKMPAIEQLTQSLPGQSCSILEDDSWLKKNEKTICIGGSVCMNGVCLCPEGSTLINNKCLKSLQSFHSPLPDNNQKNILNQIIDDNFHPTSLGQLRLGSENMYFAVNRNQHDTSLGQFQMPGIMCQVPSECPYRTECIRGVCRCKSQGETIVNGLCRKAIYEVLPGGSCDVQQGLDCVGESHCFYGICVCLYGLVNTGRECASREILTIVSAGESCALGQKCIDDAICVKGVCQCKPETIFNEMTGECMRKKIYFHNYPYHGSSEINGITVSNGELLMKSNALGKIYGLSPEKNLLNNGKFSQILTANQMSINVIDQDALRAAAKLLFLSTQPPITNNVTLVGEKCKADKECVKGLRCVRSTCQCENGKVEWNRLCINQNSPEIIQQSKEDKFINKKYNAIQSARNNDFFNNNNNNDKINLSPCNNVNNDNCQSSMYSCKSKGCSSCNQKYNNKNNRRSRHRCPQIHKPQISHSQQTQNSQPQTILQSPNLNFLKTREAGSDCLKPNYLCGWNSVCNLKSGICECPSQMDTYKGACVLARRPYGNQCTKSSNCNRNSYCDNGYCICQSEFETINGFCLPSAKSIVDDSNLYDKINGIQSVNNMETNPPLQSMNGIKISENSFINQATPHIDRFSNLFTNDMINPKINFSSNNQNYPQSTLLYLVSPGQYCNENRICQGKSNCIKYICRCAPGWKIKDDICTLGDYVPPTNSEYFELPFPTNINKKLKPRKLPYKFCNDQVAQCVDNADCVSSLNNPHVRLFGHPLCICQSGFLYVAKQCIPTFSENTKFIDIGKTCLPNLNNNKYGKHIEFCLNGSHCDESLQICICGKNQMIIAGVCINYALPGELCTNDVLCAENSICKVQTGMKNNEPVCVCPFGINAINGHCETFINPIPMKKNLEKLSFVAKSTPKTLHNIEKNNDRKYQKNLSFFLAAPLQKCGLDIQCTENSFCSPLSNLCTCKSGFSTVHNRCVKFNLIRKPGEICHRGSVCSGMSWCKEGKCECLLNDKNCKLQKQSKIAQLSSEELVESFKRLKLNIKKINSLYSSEKLLENYEHSKSKQINSAKLPKYFTCNFSDHICPLGSICQNRNCYCNNLKIEQSLLSFKNFDINMNVKHNNRFISIIKKTPKTIRLKNDKQFFKCDTDDDCPSALNCLKKTCVCIRIPEVDDFSKSAVFLAPSKKKSKTKNLNNGMNFTTQYDSKNLLKNMFCNEFNKCGIINIKSQMILPNSRYLMSQHLFSNKIKRRNPQKYFQKLIPQELDNKNLSNLRNFNGRQTLPKLFQNKTLSEVGKACEYSFDCQTNLTCFNKVCACIKLNKPNNFPQKIAKILRRDVELEALAGKSCANDELCTRGSVCINDICMCHDPKMVILESTCVEPNQLSNYTEQFSSLQNTKNKQQFSEPIGFFQIDNFTGSINALTDVSSTATMKTTLTTSATKSKRITHGEQCSPVDVCIGGSKCVESLCRCPAGTKPSQKTKVCEFYSQKMRKFYPGVASNFPLLIRREKKPTSFSRLYARPNGSCLNNEICIGASLCIATGNKKICMCPTEMPFVKNYICTSTETKDIKSKEYRTNTKIQKSFTLIASKPRQNTTVSLSKTTSQPEILLETKKTISIMPKPDVEKTINKVDYILITTIPKNKSELETTTTQTISVTNKVYARLGEKCDDLIEKRECETKAFCSDGLCRCRREFVPFNWHCVEIPKHILPLIQSQNYNQKNNVILTTPKKETLLSTFNTTTIPTLTSTFSKKTTTHLSASTTTTLDDTITSTKRPANQNLTNQNKISSKIYAPMFVVQQLHKKDIHPNNFSVDNILKHKNEMFFTAQNVYRAQRDEHIASQKTHIRKTKTKTDSQISKRNGFTSMGQSQHQLIIGLNNTSIESDKPDNKNTTTITQRKAENMTKNTKQLINSNLNDGDNFEDTNKKIDEEKTTKPTTTTTTTIRKRHKIRVTRPHKKINIATQTSKVDTIASNRFMVGDLISGICPYDNPPLKEARTGELVLCNGLKPDCPPKSYCFVTGVASGTYNCCKVN